MHIVHVLAAAPSPPAIATVCIKLYLWVWVWVCAQGAARCRRIAASIGQAHFRRRIGPNPSFPSFLAEACDIASERVKDGTAKTNETLLGAAVALSKRESKA